MKTLKNVTIFVCALNEYQKIRLSKNVMQSQDHFTSLNFFSYPELLGDEKLSHYFVKYFTKLSLKKRLLSS